MAKTAEDKFLHHGRPKRTDLDLSEVFVGTCPDMCPEGERYMRQSRKQLSVFEVVPDTDMVDHSAAIKEYSRSSADQKEPLPHELRPLPVLSMTMDYLLTQIMDQGHNNYRDWYDFVWNRTRAIRKDITQQHLCCPHTVSLIEKCTRFHVHCAHHLCEKSTSAFDAVINYENMTKCLQTLKEMYQDLAMRHIYCPMEAEFRQYSVLLKLNDGDILREVQQFRKEVRNSPEVKLAVQAFTAVNSNNFVRFFKLVNRASYLASCLLHGYFNQVRARALNILNIAFTVGSRSTAFPVQVFVRMLMFRTTEEASDFIQKYGLNVNDAVVELSRIAYQEPDMPLSQKRSEVILGKKNVLVGEVVNGGSLPNPLHHTPVCSFNSQNRYRREGPLAESTPGQFQAFADKVEVKVPAGVELLTQVVPDMHAGFRLQAGFAQQLFQPIPQPVRPPSPPPPAPPKPKPVYSNEDIIAELDSVIEEEVGAEVREVAAAGASCATTAITESGVQVESLVSQFLRLMLQEMPSTEIKLEQERVAGKKRKLEEASISSSIKRCKKGDITETAISEIQQAVKEKADIALMLEDLRVAELQRKYIKRWRDVVAVRRQLKRQMRGFPEIK